MFCSLRHPGTLIIALAWLLHYVGAEISLAVNVDDLMPLDTCNRKDVRAVVSNNKVYFFGGTSYVRNGTSKPFEVTNHYLRIADFTASRDMSDTSIMESKPVPSFVTLFFQGAFWGDSSRLYITGGQVAGRPYLTEQGQFIPTNWTSYTAGTIFTYDISSDNWGSEPALQPETGPTAQGTMCCGYFGWNAKKEQGYVFSGSNYVGAKALNPNSEWPFEYVAGPTTEADVLGNGNILTFDPKSWKWTNQTTDNQVTSPWSEFGEFVSLPGTETENGGISVLIGGVRKKPAETMESMRKVLVYDSGSGNWYNQETTAEGGAYPPARSSFCSVVASAPDNSSHNIYIYGGETSSSEDAFSDMYILTIPTFHWIRVEVDSVARRLHSCSKVADRYMVTYGGFMKKVNEVDEACDQENYGLRLFDMTSLNWTSRYEAPTTTSAYAVPSAIYNIIGGDSDGGATKSAPSAGFNTPGLEAVLNGESPETPMPTGSGSPSDPDDNGSLQDSRSSSNPNKGVIIGAVVGGIVGLAIISAALFFFLRKRKSKPEPAKSPAVTEEESVGPFETDGNAKLFFETDGKARYTYYQATEAHELQGSGDGRRIYDPPSPAQELEATSQPSKRPPTSGGQ
ncbi:hypothetical protein BS50DRAFT_77876 [Corynespora cassiicola Philippines]|uniref:Kelch repeat protein n=1 Tax=Corynespora cassiicola Philippines TaxID=1448308 RepID=A0A2T2NH49_CORCC|nr:hypothetical protein BS50DRAFT_77876 [Corynespora cassiicola Philippines]